ncbi:MAG TPA: TRASH domain-containing protein [Thermoanaerobaculia bacterium]|jgi:YHS domain-containing protein|nr:TRASH domain-containing protein [Thermoanaerobaculia bacterium]
MPKSRTFAAVLTLCTVALLVSALAFAAENGIRPTLRKVEAKKVCMVNNTVFDKDQIPVQVENKTYYGCCEMCKERLSRDVTARTATDPVTGKTVDKATAVIAAQADGKVLYFESEKTLAQYEKGQKK